MLLSSFHRLCHRSRNNLLLLALRHITLVILTINLKYDGIDIVDHLLPGNLHDRVVSNKASSVFAPMHNAKATIQQRGIVGVMKCPFYAVMQNFAQNICGINYFLDGFWREKQKEYVVSQESYLKLEEK